MESSVSNQVNFSEKEMMKYSRNIMLTDIGVEGQKLLKNSTVTIIGVGGLGCACSQYLVASGIGNLNLFDPDQVDLSNLQRQILFREEDLNAFKVDAAVTSLLRLNPDVNIKKFRQSFEKNSVPDEITKSEIILDCSDNFETRRYTNNFCYKNKIPLISLFVRLEIPTSLCQKGNERVFKINSFSSHFWSFISGRNSNM